MNQGNSPSKPSERLKQLPTQQTLNFEYALLNAETRVVVQQCTNEINTVIRRTSQDIIQIGQNLIEVKQHLGHGNFVNWLKFEFDWSISTATKFMQVAEQFKFVNFTNLNITASGLYLIAAPSTPKKARVEVLERASLGESITYNMVKAIVRQHKKGAKSELGQLVTVDVSAPAQYKTLSASFATEELTGKETQTQTCSLSSKSPQQKTAFQDKHIAATIKDVFDDNSQQPTYTVNVPTILCDMSDAVIAEMAINIKNLTPEQLTLVITKSANNGLSNHQLEAIVAASQQALNSENSLRSI